MREPRCPAGAPAGGFHEVRAAFGRVPRDPSLRYALGMEPGVAIGRLRDYFGEHAEGIACVWLFGSTARGEARTGSDVDVAVLLAADPEPTLAASGVRLADALEAALGAPVDVVLMNRAPVDLVHRVLRDGKLVVDADPARRIAFEVRSRSLYFDLKPILDQYRRKPQSSRG